MTPDAIRTTCPHCGAPLQATASVYLEEVAIDAHGRMVAGEIAYGLIEPGEIMPMPAYRVYCSSDCTVSTFADDVSTMHDNPHAGQ